MASKTAEELWTIAELTSRVSGALAGSFDGVASGRVRDVPDVRSIRYYTTIGLLDRPAEFRGRTAYYGRRHLCQLVVIKRLQSQGLSLAQVQEQLLSLPDRQLEKIAGVPPHVETASGGNLAYRSALKRKVAATRDDFWRSAPATRAQSPDEGVRQNQRPDVMTLVPLWEGLYVGFEACRAIDAKDIAALQSAAKPLQQLLIQRQLVRPELEREENGQSASDTEFC